MLLCFGDSFPEILQIFIRSCITSGKISQSYVLCRAVLMGWFGFFFFLFFVQVAAFGETLDKGTTWRKVVGMEEDILVGVKKINHIKKKKEKGNFIILILVHYGLWAELYPWPLRETKPTPVPAGAGPAAPRFGSNAACPGRPWGRFWVHRQELRRCGVGCRGLSANAPVLLAPAGPSWTRLVLRVASSPAVGLHAQTSAPCRAFLPQPGSPRGKSTPFPCCFAAKKGTCRCLCPTASPPPLDG